MSKTSSIPFNLSFNIRGRLIAGFAAVTFVLAAAVGVTLWEVKKVDGEVERIVDLRVPTAFASATMINDINASLAALRGWMLTGNGAFKTERAAVWADIAKQRESMDRLSVTWTVPENIAKWEEFKIVLDEFAIAQDQIEAIANTPEQSPATLVLVTEAAPRASIIIKSITAMINEEATLAATPERKALLGMMADVRGTMGLGIANIRAYLLTGDDAFRKNFDNFWAKNEKRFGELSANQHLLTADQNAAFEALSTARAEFAPLPPKMFDIRGSKKWNMANYLLITEAAPRAGKLMTTLAGPKAEDGSRAGGMVDNQKKLLADDGETVSSEIGMLEALEWILLVAGIAIASVVTLLTARSLVNPITAINEAMAKVAGGDTDVELEVTSNDEIGEMTRSMIDLREAVALAYERQQMIDDMPVNVITVDATDLKINFINKESLKTLKTLEHLLPVKADEMHGQCLDIFHKNPEHQRKILGDPANLPYNANIELGDQKLSLRVSAIHDKTGDYIGAMLNWTVVTEELNLANNVSEVVGIVASTATEMQTAAESLASTAEETSRQSQAAAAASEQASTNVQTVSAAAEEMSSSVNEIARQVAQSAQMAKDAVDEAEKSNVSVQSLAEGSQKIGEVVELISDIASQTNLLALNATIEAARAGDAGKGFAVVASEVKSLANQTAKATEQIASQIGSIQSATDEAVTAIEGIGKKIAEMDEVSTAIASAIEEQGAATGEISSNSQQAAQGTQEVSSNVAGVNQAATETGTAATQVLGAAGELAGHAEKLRGEVGKFLETLNAA
jgi:methyl-accepting chemotaxis protein